MEGDRESVVLFDKGTEVSSPLGSRSKAQIKDVFSILQLSVCIEPLHFLLNSSIFVVFSKDGQRVGRKKCWRLELEQEHGFKPQRPVGQIPHLKCDAVCTASLSVSPGPACFPHLHILMEPFCSHGNLPSWCITGFWSYGIQLRETISEP